MGVERCEPSSRERPANVSDVTSQIFKTNLTIRSIIPCAYEIPRFVTFGDSNRLAAAKLFCEVTHLDVDVDVDVKRWEGAAWR